MTIGSTSEEYKQQLINLAPSGEALPTDENSLWVKLLNIIADELAIVDASAVQLLNEAYPDTTNILLPNWERVAGLPDECSELGDTLAIRRLNLISKLTSTGGQSKEYFIQVAASLGFTVTVTEFRPFRVGMSRVGDPICDRNWWFCFQINAPLDTIIYFRSGSGAAGEPLRSWGNDRLECVIRKLAPAHVVVQFAYT